MTPTCAHGEARNVRIWDDYLGLGLDLIGEAAQAGAAYHCDYWALELGWQISAKKIGGDAGAGVHALLWSIVHDCRLHD
jgi:hypothetical protein